MHREGYLTHRESGVKLSSGTDKDTWAYLKYLQRPAPRGQSQKPSSFPDPAVSIRVLVVVSPPQRYHKRKRPTTTDTRCASPWTRAAQPPSPLTSHLTSQPSQLPQHSSLCPTTRARLPSPQPRLALSLHQRLMSVRFLWPGPRAPRCPALPSCLPALLALLSVCAAPVCTARLPPPCAASLTCTACQPPDLHSPHACTAIALPAHSALPAHLHCQPDAHCPLDLHCEPSQPILKATWLCPQRCSASHPAHSGARKGGPPQSQIHTVSHPQSLTGK